jgi:hypothetical protein
MAKPPVELPQPPAAKPMQPPAPRARVSPILVVLLILAVLGGGAFVVWKYVLEKQGPSVGTTTEPAPVPVKPPPAPPPPPPAPASKIVLETPAPDEVKLTQPGQIETILPDNATVKAGDVIVRLVGDKPLEAEIAGISRDTKRLQAQLDAWTKRLETAQTSGNKAGEAAAEAELADRKKTMAAKQDLLATKTTALDKFLLHAERSGTFTPASKPGQKVAADDVVAKIQHEAAPSATFKVGDAKPFAANASIELSVGKGEQHVTCTIAEVQPDSVKVVCPADPALVSDADVTLKPAPAPAPATGSSGPK